MGSALGVLKVAAKRVGVDVDEYQARVADGLKWCTGCKDWHPLVRFPIDRSRGDGRRARCLEAEHGKRVTRRSPDREKARGAVRYAILTGRIPHANLRPCTDCGHIWQPGDRRHEHDHYLGYAEEHRLDVEPVCTICHANREKKRRESNG